jgi:2-polyprenyl-3-methyl-5-hydroxy-6-metoxy-1,4-benzoquinol methylase
MARSWNPKQFDTLWERFICQDELHFGGRDYYRRYRSRYKTCTQRLAMLAPTTPLDVLDIGGGQHALMCNKLWGDRAVLADIAGAQLLHQYMEKHGVPVYIWNVCTSDAPFSDKFDVIFFSEVIEHLPIPGFISLERLRKVLRPGGLIICTTPNLYRLRNVFCMAFGLKIFDYFQLPNEEDSLGHVIEYSRDHLLWQFEKAGFNQINIEHCQMHHLPTNPFFRPLALLGYPLHVVPRWRDNLLAIAQSPINIK